MIQEMYEALCDKPECASALPTRLPGPELADAGWLSISSGQGEGAFWVHLCPEHHETFTDHLPRTMAMGRGPAHLGAKVKVSCSCGAEFPWQYDTHMVRPGGPSHAPTRVWWDHLPR